MLEVCRLSPAPAMLLLGQPAGEGHDWEINAAARAFAPAATWDDAGWQRLADRVRDATNRAEHDGQAGDLGLRWRAVASDGGLLVWLEPSAPSPAARTEGLPLATAIELMDLSVWRVDLVQRLAYANARGFELAGVIDPPRDGQGVPLDAVRSLEHPDDTERLVRASEAALAPGAGVVDVQVRQRQPDGSYRALMTRRVAERDPSGRATGLIGVSFDVTAQTEAVRREQAAALSLQLITEASGIGAWTIDAERDTLTWHGEMALLLGPDGARVLTLDEARRQAQRRVHPDDWPLVHAGLRRIVESDFSAGEWTFRVLRDDGAVRWLSSRVRRLHGAPGTSAPSGVVIDVTEHHDALQRLREVERRATMAAEVGRFGLWTYDLVSGQRTWDAQMFRLRGIDPSTNPDLDQVRIATTHPDDMAVIGAMLEAEAQRLRDGRPPAPTTPLTAELRVFLPDGSLRWLASRGIVVREPGKNAQVIGLHWDITEQKQAEELRRQSAAALQASEAKSRFLANMSHDIRTPINAILGMSHLALRSGLDARQHNYVLKIDRSAKSLLGLINDILDFSKIEADKLHLEQVEFELDDVLGDLANLVALPAQDKGLELVFAVPARLPRRLIGDPLRLGQVLINLAGNAVKFTERGEVVLAVDLVERVDAPEAALTLRFSVSDSGIGMTPQYLERLFEPFEQAAPSTSRQHGGTGLGLAISRRLVQMMGGTLEVSSVLGSGSRFGFSLAFGVPGAVAGAAEPASLSGERVLIVDDNLRVRELLMQSCRDLGAAVEAVADGWDALRAVAVAATAGAPFALVLIDAALDSMDGVACALELRAGAHGARAIALTSTPFNHDSVAQRLAAAGLLNCPVLIKPILPAALRAALLTALGRPPGIDPAARAVPDLRHGALQHVRVLLVDDNDINQELASELLGDAGLRVTVAEHGRQAIEMLQRQPFDVVLMDCQMPVMDGYEATQEIRRNPAWATLPIIAMTANVMSGDRDRALASGMNDHIAKPIDIDAMFETLARWVNDSPKVA